MTYLLDINVLLALSDPSHTHHDAAHDWFQERGAASWATCPIVENGFVRIASHPSYPNRPGDTQAVLQLLRTLCQAQGHSFWPDTITLRTSLSDQAALTSKQVTDLYLLALAVENRGKLATFDKNINAELIVNGAPSLELLGRS